MSPSKHLFLFKHIQNDQLIFKNGQNNYNGSK